MARFLILQLRPETEAADGEYDAFLRMGGLVPEQVRRIRLDQERMPDDALTDVTGVIVGGGPGCVSDAPDDKDPIEARIEADILALMPEIVARDMPFMGCCYGIGILAHHLGAEVSKARYGEPVGPVEVIREPASDGDPILDGLPERFTALVGHKEAVQVLPRDTQHLLSSVPCPFQMIRYRDNVYATQFHPEADADVFENRIHVYKNRGYFDPAEADDLIARCHANPTDLAPRILRNFVRRYSA